MSQLDASGRVLVSVRDTGTGLGPNRDRMFDPFFTTKPGGMGLGVRDLEQARSRFGHGFGRTAREQTE
jgi:nitrogen-specific signal transduction histidine kinase